MEPGHPGSRIWTLLNHCSLCSDGRVTGLYRVHNAGAGGFLEEVMSEHLDHETALGGQGEGSVSGMREQHTKSQGEKSTETHQGSRSNSRPPHVHPWPWSQASFEP